MGAGPSADARHGRRQTLAMPNGIGGSTAGRQSSGAAQQQLQMHASGTSRRPSRRMGGTVHGITAADTVEARAEHVRRHVNDMDTNMWSKTDEKGEELVQKLMLAPPGRIEEVGSSVHVMMYVVLWDSVMFNVLWNFICRHALSLHLHACSSRARVLVMRIRGSGTCFFLFLCAGSESARWITR